MTDHDDLEFVYGSDTLVLGAKLTPIATIAIRPLMAIIVVK
jgi:hypothetical protein